MTPMTNQEFLLFLENINSQQLLQYLIDSKLIFDRINCIYCDTEMILTKFDKSDLGSNWRCMNLNCSHFQTTLSLLHRSFFHNNL